MKDWQTLPSSPDAKKNKKLLSSFLAHHTHEGNPIFMWKKREARENKQQPVRLYTSWPEHCVEWETRKLCFVILTRQLSQTFFFFFFFYHNEYKFSAWRAKINKVRQFHVVVFWVTGSKIGTFLSTSTVVAQFNNETTQFCLIWQRFQIPKIYLSLQTRSYSSTFKILYIFS